MGSWLDCEVSLWHVDENNSHLTKLKCKRQDCNTILCNQQHRNKEEPVKLLNMSFLCSIHRCDVVLQLQLCRESDVCPSVWVSCVSVELHSCTNQKMIRIIPLYPAVLNSISFSLCYGPFHGCSCSRWFTVQSQSNLKLDYCGETTIQWLHWNETSQIRCFSEMCGFQSRSH